MADKPAPARASDTFDLKKKVLRLETLYDVSRSLAAARDEKTLLEEMIGRAVSVLDAARGFAAAFEDGGGAGRSSPSDSLRLTRSRWLRTPSSSTSAARERLSRERARASSAFPWEASRERRSSRADRSSVSPS